jgi:hypothetical protein
MSLATRRGLSFLREVWRRVRRWFWRALEVGLWLLVCALALAYSSPPPQDIVAILGRVTGDYSFDYVTWEVDALLGKLDAALFGVHPYLEEDQRAHVVRDYLDLVNHTHHLEEQVRQIYGDPSIEDPEAASAELRAERDALRAQQGRTQPLAESIVEGQIASVLRDEGMAWLGQVLPPVALHFTEPPNVMVISPRDRIETQHTQGLRPGIPVDVQERLEDEVDAALGVSSLIVPIGGMALYPSMVIESEWFYSAFEVSAHEWTHHWFFLFPIGLGYLGPYPETATINETATSIIGHELAHKVVERFYPELVPLLPPLPWEVEPPPSDAEPPAFNYDTEMRETRITVDRLLEEGKIEEAETYMEARRQLFADQGFYIRKLNQAYFAFYGGYQAAPAGPAGEDPIGPAVREIRQLAPSLRDFYWRMTGVTTREALQAALEQSRAEWGAGDE